MIIAGIPIMVTMGFRLGIVYLKFKMKAKKAAAVFERELLARGMDREMARRLTEMYLESSRIVHMGIRSVGNAGNNGQSLRL